MTVKIPEPTKSDVLIMMLEQHREILISSDSAMISGKYYSTNSMAFKDIIKGFDEAIRLAKLVNQ